MTGEECQSIQARCSTDKGWQVVGTRSRGAWETADCVVRAMETDSSPPSLPHAHPANRNTPSGIAAALLLSGTGRLENAAVMDSMQRAEGRCQLPAPPRGTLARHTAHAARRTQNAATATRSNCLPSLLLTVPGRGWWWGVCQHTMAAAHGVSRWVTATTSVTAPCAAATHQ